MIFPKNEAVDTEEKTERQTNRGIYMLCFVLAAMFFSVAGYMAYLNSISQTVINNPYNKRLDALSEKVLRGSIISADGEILAKTVEEDGEEKRVYPYGALFSHAVGYSQMGKTGVEALVNFYLLQSNVSWKEKLENLMNGRKDPGDSVTVTLDLGLQQTAADALGGRNGAVVAMEPDTGRILAMVSCPDFDPNNVEEEWESLINGDSTDARLLNRAIYGLYPPGSVFKTIILLEYIREHPDDWRDFAFDCSGIYEDGGYSISCYHKTAHGHQTIGQAYANSCNGAFAFAGSTLDTDSLRELAGDMLFGNELPFELGSAESSFSLAADPEKWELLQTSIGQGNTMVSPLHMLLITSAIANDGLLMQPYILSSVNAEDGSETESFAPKEYGQLMTEEEAQILGTAMKMVVNEGTASALRTDAYEAAGKTGSAEFETGKETHAWFTGYAPVDDPKIAVAVIVEEAGSGGSVAAPIARAVFDEWITH